ncbi:MAG: putative dehydrogenase [Gammaproteobacteria bacterium]|jgi:NAD(P)-dependent dehydrogenase (short-subunit alcohol dehydrogenase family)|nr:putative dehydrogenase [Gammaproteobacteria bacterium]
MTTPVVLITGGLTGIGRAAALAFAKQNARVVVSGRGEEAGQALVSELRKLGTEAEFIRADVRQEEDVRQLVDGTVKRFGRLDVAINNAGTEGKPGAVTDQTAESYAATFDTNVLGVVLSLKHEIRVMRAQGAGSVINISSTYGHEGAAGASIYAASKHAVEGLTKSVALEVAESGVRVNAVAPGPTDTGMLDRFTGGEAGKAYMRSVVPMKRLGKPDELARAILFLASSDASFVTGQILSVDGGKSAG